MRSGTPRTKLGRDLANTRWHGGAKREVADILSGDYEPLNPETFGKPAPKPLPFTPAPLDMWATKRQARQLAEAKPCSIVPVSQPETVRAELVVHRTENFKVLYQEHWCETRMCWEVQSHAGAYKGTFFDEAVACLYADECEAWQAVMAIAKTFNHLLEDIPF